MSTAYELRPRGHSTRATYERANLMAEATETVLDIDRVLFLDERNRKFVEKTSPVTSRVRDARELLGQIFIIAIFFGGVSYVAISTHVLNSQLAKSGKVTTGVITAKDHSRQICRVTYQFSGPPIYERKADLASDLCPTLTKGQLVEVVYDPQQPLYSNLKVSMNKPRIPLWPAVFSALIVFGTIVPQIKKLRREHHLCEEGQVICGTLVSKNFEIDTLRIRFRFRVPAGFTIASEAEGRVRRSSWRDDMRFFPDQPNLVAVLFVNESEFYPL